MVSTSPCSAISTFGASQIVLTAAAGGLGRDSRYPKLVMNRPTKCHLLRRRGSLGTSQPLSEIAYASGSRDETHFARKFRRRFGYPPGAHSERLGHSGDRTVRINPSEGALRAHDV